MNAANEAAAAEEAALAKAKADAEYAKQQAAIDKAKAAADKKAQAEYDRLLKKTSGTTRTSRERAEVAARADPRLEVDPDDPERRHPRHVRHRQALRFARDAAS